MESANFVVVLKISIGCTYFFSHNFLSHHDEVYPSVSMWQMMSFPRVWKKNAARRLWLSDSMLNHGEGPTCSALNHTKIKSHSLSPKEEQAGTVHPGRDACQRWKKWSPQHSCAPCVALSVASSGWRQWTPSLLRRADVPSQNAHSHAWKCLFFQISSRRYINQPALKHVLPSHNEFNTLLSAILMIQSRDFPIAT